MGFHTFAAGEVLTASNVQNYLMNQAVIGCTSGTRPGAPQVGMTIFETDTLKLRVYNGTGWSEVGRLDVLNTWTKMQTFTPASAAGVSATFTDSVNSSLRVSHPASGILRYDADGGNSHQWTIGSTQYAILSTTGLTVNGGIGATGALSSASLATGALSASTGTFTAAVGIAAGFALNADYVAAIGNTGAYLATTPGSGIEIRGRSAGIVPFASKSASAGTSSAIFSDDVRSTLTVTHPSSAVAGLNVGGSESLALTFGGTANLTAKSDTQAVAGGLTDYATNLWVRYRKDYTLTPAFFHEQVSLGNDGSVPAGYRPLCVPA